MHIGLIGGIGPAATEFYYRGLIDRHAAAGTFADLTIAHADMREMCRNMLAKAPAQQAEIFARLIAPAARRRRGTRRRHLDGRPFLRQRTGGDFAAAPPQRHPRGRCRPRAREASDDRHYRHAHRYGIEALWRHYLGEVLRPEGQALDGVHAAYITMATSGHVIDGHAGVFCGRAAS